MARKDKSLIAVARVVDHRWNFVHVGADKCDTVFHDLPLWLWLRAVHSVTHAA